ncbi:MAG: phage tail tape measure protein [Rhizobiales bacterium]|nr:phage tail tape measure protein [Hyphomicrobiales bacterium]
MSNLKAELLITADAKGLKKEVKRSIKDLMGLGKGGIATAKDLKRIEKTSKKSGISLKKLGGDAKKLNKGFKALGKTKLPKVLKKTDAAAKKVTGSFKATARQTNDLKRKQDALARSADIASKKLLKEAAAAKELARQQRGLKNTKINNGVASTGSRDTKGRFIKGAGKPNKRNDKKSKLKSVAKTSGNLVFAGGRKMGALAGGLGLMAFTGAVNKSYDNVVEAIARNDVMAGALSSVGIEDPEILLNKFRKQQLKFAGVTSYASADAAYGVASTFPKMDDNSVGEFTVAAAITAKATKGDVAGMAANFIAGYSTFKNEFKHLNDQEFATYYANVMSQVVLNNKTDGDQMKAMIKNMGAGLTLSGMPMAEQFAIGAIMQEKLEGSEVGTMLKAFAANIAKAQARFSKSGKKIKTLDKDNMILPLVKIIENLKKAYGEKWDAKEQAEMSEAFGGVEAASVLFAMKDKSKLILSQEKTYQGQSHENLDVVTNMALAHDKNSIAAEKTLNAQAKDVVLQEMGKARRKEILAKERSEKEAHIADAKFVRGKGSDLTNSEMAAILAKDAAKEVGGYSGHMATKFYDWHVDGLGKVYDTFTDLITGKSNVSDYIEVSEIPKPATPKPVISKTDDKKSDGIDWSSFLPSITFTTGEDLKKIDKPKKPALVNQENQHLKSTTIPQSKPVKKWDPQAFYNLPMDFDKWDVALTQLKSLGISSLSKPVKEAARAVGMGDINLEQFNAIIGRLEKAISTDRLSMLIAELAALKTPLAEPDTVELATTNIDNDFDQSQDNRKYEKKISVVNHIIVNMKSNASPAAVGQAIGVHAVQAVKQGEALADGEF